MSQAGFHLIVQDHNPHLEHFYGAVFQTTTLDYNLITHLFKHCGI